MIFTSPDAMADWLEENCEPKSWDPQEYWDAFNEIAAYLRTVPSPEARREAIDSAGEAAELGGSVAEEFEACAREPWRYQYPRYWPNHDVAFYAAQAARRALRLLGLED